MAAEAAKREDLVTDRRGQAPKRPGARMTDVWTLPPGPSLTAEQRRMVEAALPLARPVVMDMIRARPFAARYMDDLMAEARVGFIIAAQRFDSRRGERWRSYAYGGGLIRCRAWLQAMARREMFSTDEPLGCNGKDGPGGWLDLRAGDGPSPEEEAIASEALAALKSLPARQQMAVSRFLDDRTLREVGEEMGVTVEGARLIEMDGLHALRVHFGVPSLSRQERLQPSYETNAARVREVLKDGQPRTVREVAEAIGRTVVYVRHGLRACGAVKEGQKLVGNGAGRKLVDTWRLP